MRAPRPLLALLERLGPLVNAPSLARAVLPHIGRRDTHHYWRLVEAQDDYRRSFARALDGAPGGPFDLIVTPGCALPALRHGEGANLGFIGGYSALFNLLGYPAGVVPVSRVRTDEERTRPRARDATLEAARRVDAGSTGLPVGVQVVARPWREHLVLGAMQAIETAAGEGADFPRTPRLPAEEGGDGLAEAL
jgi:fatty acid amide hydrolase